jgi:uncharacterized Fe-S cluster protein YjdI
MKDIIKKYSNGEVTVIWQPSKCIHSTICFKGLPKVFDPGKRPWVNAQGAITEEIIKQVDKCPSGALSYLQNNKEETQEENRMETKVEVLKNGPLMVQGTIKVKDQTGKEFTKTDKTFFCRCGGSKNRPYCDGTHRKNDFKDENF